MSKWLSYSSKRRGRYYGPSEHFKDYRNEMKQIYILKSPSYYNVHSTMY